jgi:hypothetical protein
MATQADIVLADGQGTPVNHTFFASGVTKNGIAKYYDRALGVPVLMPRVEFAFYPAADATPKQKGADIDRLASKVNIKVFVPEPDVLGVNAGGYTPAPSEAFVNSFNGTFTLASRSGLQSRKDILAYVISAMQKSMVSDAVVDWEGVFG